MRKFRAGAIGQAYLGKRMYDEAISNINKAIALSEGNVRMKATLGYAYAVASKRGEAQQIIDELQAQSTQKYVSAYFIAVIYSGLGDKDQAFKWLESCVQSISLGVQCPKLRVLSALRVCGELMCKAGKRQRTQHSQGHHFNRTKRKSL